MGRPCRCCGECHHTPGCRLPISAGLSYSFTGQRCGWCQTTAAKFDDERPPSGDEDFPPGGSPHAISGDAQWAWRPVSRRVVFREDSRIRLTPVGGMNGERVSLIAADGAVLPEGLAAGPYYVINADGVECQLAETFNGEAVTFSGSGSGTITASLATNWGAGSLGEHCQLALEGTSGAAGIVYPMYAWGYDGSDSGFMVTLETDGTVTSSNLGFRPADGLEVYFRSAIAGGLPSALEPRQRYFCVESSGQTCRIAATAGGSPITFSTTGTGEIYLYYGYNRLQVDQHGACIVAAFHRDVGSSVKVWAGLVGSYGLMYETGATGWQLVTIGEDGSQTSIDSSPSPLPDVTDGEYVYGSRKQILIILKIEVTQDEGLLVSLIGCYGNNGYDPGSFQFGTREVVQFYAPVSAAGLFKVGLGAEILGDTDRPYGATVNYTCTPDLVWPYPVAGLCYIPELRKVPYQSATAEVIQRQYPDSINIDGISFSRPAGSPIGSGIIPYSGTLTLLYEPRSSLLLDLENGYGQFPKGDAATGSFKTLPYFLRLPWVDTGYVVLDGSCNDIGWTLHESLDVFFRATNTYRTILVFQYRWVLFRVSAGTTYFATTIELSGLCAGQRYTNDPGSVWATDGIVGETIAQYEFAVWNEDFERYSGICGTSAVMTQEAIAPPGACSSIGGSMLAALDCATIAPSVTVSF